MLLLAGLGPYEMGGQSLDGTLFARGANGGLQESYRRLLGHPLDLGRLWYGGPPRNVGDEPPGQDTTGRPLLRPYRGSVPHLSLQTVRAIVETTDVELEVFDLQDLWLDSEPRGTDFDVVGLSTTFICDAYTLQRTVQWIAKRFPAATVVLGGQYSNLKYAQILSAYPAVDYVVRGDGELAFPKLLRALADGREIDGIPNLAARNGRGLPVATPIEYVDFDALPSPVFQGAHDVVPYESMRGCPFSCKFCSFPAASPVWRHKSAERICRDWRAYAETNGATLISAMDSTFTVPRTRFRDLLAVLPDIGIPWEAYSRANCIDTPALVEGLEAAHCRGLRIGFESMNDFVLKAMDKKVTAAENERALELLADSQVDLKASFMVGYPGETPLAYEDTHRFLVDRFRGKFIMSVFTLTDETMPVLEDLPRFQLEYSHPLAWKHVGMDSQTAGALREKTMVDVRWNNDDAVLNLWQMAYSRPLVPEFDVQQNQRVEKLVERLAFVPKDLGDGVAAGERCRQALTELRALGIESLDAPPPS